MSSPVEVLGMYLHLADASQRRLRPMVRDRLLILAAAQASSMDLDRVADYCRHQVLEHNPNHLLRRWPTVRDALGDEDFLVFLKQMRRRYPQEKAERMLSVLDIEMGREREAYYSDEEYAAALLGTTPEGLAT